MHACHADTGLDDGAGDRGSDLPQRGAACGRAGGREPAGRPAAAPGLHLPNMPAVFGVGYGLAEGLCPTLHAMSCIAQRPCNTQPHIGGAGRCIVPQTWRGWLEGGYLVVTRWLPDYHGWGTCINSCRLAGGSSARREYHSLVSDLKEMSRVRGVRGMRGVREVAHRPTPAGHVLSCVTSMSRLPRLPLHRFERSQGQFL